MWVGIHYQKPKMKDSTSCSIKKYTNKTTSCDLQGWGFLHPSNNSARSSQASACRKQNWERTTTANLWLTLHRPLVSIWRRSAWKIARLHCTFLYNSHANNAWPPAFPTNACMLMHQCEFSHYSQFNARIALNGCFNLRSKTFVCKYCKSTDIVLQSHISHDCPAKNNQMHWQVNHFNVRVEKKTSQGIFWGHSSSWSH